ncbi:MAG: multidrug efflux SMR transporter [Bacteroidetes bacterium]|nr:multidrug efflux SMR transporter [Bacteroidota bacterium]MBU1578182.1 multidrug efflux SMR transporter [Bacteroidota bacterium]MBU2466928.1 multidrug efflux SMR transporter [Bacteroidota bacterium]MBU2557250.1 multidrug efflux SMR transporter [Bacteroidota bacterium]
MPWFTLIIAGLFEVAFAASLSKARTSGAPESYWWFTAFLISLSLSMWLLYRATHHIPMGTAYGVWTGIGAVGTVLVGIIFFQEAVNFWRLFFISTLIISIVGLKIVSAAS